MSFRVSKPDASALYMHETIDLLTRLAESERKPKGRSSLRENKENNPLRRGSEARKPSVYAENTSAILMLKNVNKV